MRAPAKSSRDTAARRKTIEASPAKSGKQITMADRLKAMRSVPAVRKTVLPAHDLASEPVVIPDDQIVATIRARRALDQPVKELTIQPVNEVGNG